MKQTFNHFPRLRAAILLACVWVSAGFAAGPATNPSEEYDIKAVFLFNFTRFVEWPTSGGEPSVKPLVIGVLGDDPFAGRLEDAIRGETTGKRAVTARRLSDVTQAASCDAVFICRSEKSRVEKILRELNGRPVLTVSDIPEFAELGGMVEFVTEKSKVRLHINVDACKAAALTVSSKLLRPAVIVTTRKSSRFHQRLSSPLFALKEPTSLVPSHQWDYLSISGSD
jgi:hypothetical protein